MKLGRWARGVVLVACVLAGPAMRAATALAQHAELQPRTVAFVLPRTSDDVAASLRHAVEAQLSSLGLHAEFSTASNEEATLGVRLDLALEQSRRPDVLATFLLDTPSEGRWLLYLVSADGERIMVRRMSADGARSNVAVEAVGVIVRDYASALRRGYRIGLTPADASEPLAPPAATAAAETSSRAKPPRTDSDTGTDPDADTDQDTDPDASAAADAEPGDDGEEAREVEAAEEPEAPPSPPWAPPGGLALRLGYRGGKLASELPFQHGMGVSAELPAWDGVQLGLGYHLHLPTRLDDPDVTMDIVRHGLEPSIGYRFALASRVGLLLQLAALAELFVRSSENAGPGLSPAATAVHPLFGLGLGVRGEVGLARPLWLWIGAEAAAVTERMAVYVEAPQRRLVLAVEPVRWSLSGGLVVRP